MTFPNFSVGAFGASAPTFGMGGIKGFNFGAGSAGSKIASAFGGAGAGKAAGLGSMLPMAGMIGLGAADLFLKQRQGQQQLGLQADIANAQIKASQDRLRNEIQLAREASKFAEGSRIGSRVAQLGYGADLDFGRQLQAGRIQRGEFAEKEEANRMRSRRADRDFELSGLTRNVRDEESRRRMKESLASSLAAGRGMFGPIAPVNVSDMVI